MSDDFAYEKALASWEQAEKAMQRAAAIHEVASLYEALDDIASAERHLAAVLSHIADNHGEEGT